MKKLETKSTVLLKHHLKALKMPSMHDECEKVAARCAKENIDHLGFLLQLSEQELIGREKRAADRRLKAAKFPNLKTLEGFEFEAQPTINRVLVSELMRGEYIEKRESIILIGHPGTGKNARRHSLRNRRLRAGKEGPVPSRDRADYSVDGSPRRSSVDAYERTTRKD